MSAHRYAQKVQQSELPARADHHLAFVSAPVRHAPIVAGRAPSTEVQSQQNQPSIAVHSTDDGGQTLSIDASVAINLALSRAGLSLKEAAARMDLDASLWSRQLQGGKGANIDFRKLLLLPISFWREFIPLLAEPAQLAVTHEDLAEIALKQVGVAMENLTRGIASLLTARRVA